MATFVELDSNNIVLRGIAIHNNECLENGVESEAKGIQFCQSLYGPNTIWKQTSYNTIGGVHKLGGTPLRKNHAGIGHTYDEDRDAFIAPKPYPSWILNETTCQWEAPVIKPDDDNNYIWNEENQQWDLNE